MKKEKTEIKEYRLLFEDIHTFRDEESKEKKASLKGLNRNRLWVVSWFGHTPVLEKRHMYFSETTGQWIPREKMSLTVEDWCFLTETRDRIDLVTSSLRTQPKTPKETKGIKVV